MPNYKRIYTDMINLRYPDKKTECCHILSKEKLTIVDVLTVNKILFGEAAENRRLSKKHRSYDKTTILYILEFQKKHKLNNTRLADHFKLSRNTIHKWRKLFLI
ncbi:helix-turn-helix domain-containing protein [Chryseobacterium oranimense]|uniref:helix-turn-helix domain-containing protein n=1 Tax=Chryseobacterium oranimense TaxID=421058 RepID=UPI0021AE6907|nr:helix-turn-helix domain-containing protein [Chryseobacterium oranimense]UWX61538.1 helix-turn-helix domain-containing protein [Chryseobacterium oranimense]